MKTGLGICGLMVLTVLPVDGEGPLRVAVAENGSTQTVKNIVLVHGAFADGSSWSKVIPLLQAKGFRVTAVGNPLTSFADDLAATKRAIAAQDGPTVLVGHSYAGIVITEADNDPKVVSLVYIAAFAPDADQTIGDLSKGFPKTAGLDQLQPQARRLSAVVGKRHRGRLCAGSDAVREGAAGGHTGSNQ
jgi:pimeloyl-ACP methyl ester carboxylesterase